MRTKCRIILLAAAALACLAALQALSVAWAVARLRSEARADLAAPEGTDRFDWEMDSAGETCPEISSGLSAPEAESGRLSFISLDSDPYFFPDLNNRRISSWRFETLTIRIFSSLPSCLQVFFWEAESRNPAGSDPVPTEKGWQTIDINLQSAAFRYAGDARPVRWGGESGQISTLRIDPASAPGIAISLDFARLGPIRRSHAAAGAISATPAASAIGLNPMDPSIAAKALSAGPAPPLLRVFARPAPGDGQADWARGLAESAAGSSSLVIARMESASPTGPELEILRALGPSILFVEFDVFWTRPEQALSAVRKARIAARGAPVFPRPADAACEVRAAESASIAGTPPAGRSGLLPKAAEYALFAVLAACGIAAALFFRSVRSSSWTGPAGRDCGPATLPQSAGARSIGAAEIALFTASVLYGMAAFDRTAEAPAVWGASVAAIAGIAARLAAGPAAALGIGAAHVRAGALRTTLLTLAALSAMVLIGMAAESLRFRGFRPGHLGFYVVKAAGQQAVLCLFLARAAAQAAGREGPAAAMTASFAFALLHMPNLTLAAGVFVLGFFWVSIYFRTRAFVLLAVSHAILGNALTTLLSPPLLISNRTGAGFFG